MVHHMPSALTGRAPAPSARGVISRPPVGVGPQMIHSEGSKFPCRRADRSVANTEIVEGQEHIKAQGIISLEDQEIGAVGRARDLRIKVNACFASRRWALVDRELQCIGPIIGDHSVGLWDRNTIVGRRHRFAGVYEVTVAITGGRVVVITDDKRRSWAAKKRVGITK